MASPLWLVHLIKKSFRGIFVLAGLTRVPGLGRLIEYGLFEGDDIMYLPGDRVISLDRPVEPSEDMVLPSAVVDHFIRQAEFRWIMNACICREASHCRDYPENLGCLFLGRAAMGINPGLGRPVTEAEALDHVRKCREAGLVHLIGRNKLDAVWLNVRPGRRLLTICNCCPCCCLWRIIPEASQKIAAKVTRMPGVEVTITDECLGCGACQDGVCFLGAIKLQNGRAEIDDTCRGCGRCVEACPTGAIQLSFDPVRSVDKSITRLSEKVDVL